MMKMSFILSLVKLISCYLLFGSDNVCSVGLKDVCSIDQHYKKLLKINFSCSEE